MSLGGLIVLSLALGLLAWLFFVWTVRSGQYEDPEGAKYRMLEDDDGDPGPPRPAPPSTGPGPASASATGQGPERPGNGLGPRR